MTSDPHRRHLHRQGLSLPVTNSANDYLPGDIVTWMLRGNAPHIEIVVDFRSSDGERPLIVHNIGFGPKMNDMLFDYEITGLVVSKHNADTWWDWVHAASHDHLNVTDLCVVWGDNARSGSYQDMRFSSGQWTCNFKTDSDAAFAAFDG